MTRRCPSLIRSHSSDASSDCKKSETRRDAVSARPQYVVDAGHDTHNQPLPDEERLRDADSHPPRRTIDSRLFVRVHQLEHADLAQSLLQSRCQLFVP